MLTGLQVGVLGAGRSGKAAALLAKAKGAKVTLYDQNNNDPKLDNIAFVGGVDESFGETLKTDLLVLSPGIDTYGSLAKAFGKQADEVIGEVELASRYYEGRIVGITGTNGKTTTTELVELFIKSSGHSCLACGNYGLPVAEIVLQEEQPEYLALELSSFQLETIKDLHLDVAVWLNFAADHMDRYPTLEAYKVAKERIFINIQSDDFVICRLGENIPAHKGRSLSFVAGDETADWMASGKKIYFGGNVVVDLETTRLRGSHNAENVCAALAAVTAIGLSTENVQDALDLYQPPAHRCELIATIDGVEYLNDSKATNLHSLESAIGALSGNLILICGGKEKGLDYSPLRKLIPQKVNAMICIGEIASKLAEEFKGLTKTFVSESLESAVQTASCEAQSGEIVLFSPGTSSFDMFSGYEERGDAYRKLVKSLINL